MPSLPRRLAFLCFSLFTFSFLGSIYVPGAMAQGKKAKDILVFESPQIDQNFIVIGRVHAKAGSFQRLQKQVKKIAAKQGGDAVIAYHVENRAMPSLWSGAQVSYAEGVVVKFAPEGVHALRADAVIPVLE